MRKTRALLIYWLPVLLWMALIFSASSDTRSAHRSSRIIGPLVRWLYPEISDETLSAIGLIVRKCAHLTEYAILSLLLWRAFRQPAKGDRRPWSWSLAGWAVFGVMLYAITDEVHQSFVPFREGSPVDVIIDTVGGTLGMLFLWLVGRRRKHW